jgi:hypothetical protein
MHTFYITLHPSLSLFLSLFLNHLLHYVEEEEKAKLEAENLKRESEAAAAKAEQLKIEGGIIYFIRSNMHLSPFFFTFYSRTNKTR